jgi:hypothetical protein
MLALLAGAATVMAVALPPPAPVEPVTADYYGTVVTDDTVGGKTARTILENVFCPPRCWAST